MSIAGEGKVLPTRCPSSESANLFECDSDEREAGGKRGGVGWGGMRGGGKTVFSLPYIVSCRSNSS